MTLAVQILYRALWAQAESPLIVLRESGKAQETRAEVIRLMEQLRLSFTHKRDSVQTANGCCMTFVSGTDLDMLCGVRSDLLFARLSEWTPEEVNTLLKPFLTGGTFSLYRWKVTQALLKGGHMTEADLRPTSIDDYLVNLDTL